MSMSETEERKIPKMTAQDIQDLIEKEEYLRPSHVPEMTMCVLTLKSGYAVTGESACLNAGDFDEDLGQRIARENAFDKIWALEGYHRKAMAQLGGVSRSANEVSGAFKDMQGKSDSDDDTPPLPVGLGDTIFVRGAPDVYPMLEHEAPAIVTGIGVNGSVWCTALMPAHSPMLVSKAQHDLKGPSGSAPVVYRHRGEVWLRPVRGGACLRPVAACVRLRLTGSGTLHASGIWRDLRRDARQALTT
jgi:hypothetical protein